MPKWKQPFDLYNNTFDNFNPFDVKIITKELVDKYFPFEACFVCMLDYEEPKRECFDTEICKLRLKDKTTNKTVVLTRGLGRNDPKSLTMRTGNFIWLYKNNFEFILRACQENGIDLHHINGNPYDNRWSNVAMVDTHSEIHGKLKRISTVIADLKIELQQSYSKTLYKSIKKLEEYHKKESENIKDCPKVFRIQHIVTQVLHGNKTIYDAQLELENIGAALPTSVVENYDLRSVKGKQEQIIKMERKKGKRDAIQDLQQLVV